ncbi:BlaI/MecI/CopY family transcriptional regulator [Actinoplanes sp. CA-030573]|uniref:BlaI/MecI/CopY family transcriptional regulator n=1 Tax=Actinoplanes sp. CA-030573 TaxID=3239898 RepID=UPI003D8FD1A5
MTKDSRRPPGELEAAVMGVLWAAEAPMTAAEVQRELGAGLAYNTVQTVLFRLHDKQAVERDRAGRGHVYWPARDAASAAASRMRAALEDRADRHAVLQRFAASLDAADAAMLRQLLIDTEREPLTATERREPAIESERRGNR